MPCRAAPAFEAVVKAQVRHIAIDTRPAAHAPCGQTAGVVFPAVGQFGVQPAVRALGEVRVPAQAHGLRDARPRLVKARCSSSASGVSTKRWRSSKAKGQWCIGRVHVAQFGFMLLLEATTSHGRCQATPCTECGLSSKLGCRAVVLPQPAEAPVAQPVGVRCQRVAGRSGASCSSSPRVRCCASPPHRRNHRPATGAAQVRHARLGAGRPRASREKWMSSCVDDACPSLRACGRLVPMMPQSQGRPRPRQSARTYPRVSGAPRSTLR